LITFENRKFVTMMKLTITDMLTQQKRFLAEI